MSADPLSSWLRSDTWISCLSRSSGEHKRQTSDLVWLGSWCDSVWRCSTFLHTSTDCFDAALPRGSFVKVNCLQWHALRAYLLMPMGSMYDLSLLCSRRCWWNVQLLGPWKYFQEWANLTLNCQPKMPSRCASFAVLCNRKHLDLFIQPGWSCNITQCGWEAVEWDSSGEASYLVPIDIYIRT